MAVNRAMDFIPPTDKFFLSDAYLLRGKIYEFMIYDFANKQRYLDYANEDFSKAISLNRHSVEAYYERAIFYQEYLLNEQLSIADLEQVIALDRKHIGAYLKLADVYASKSNQKALEYANKAIILVETDPKTYASYAPNVYYTRADLNYRFKKYEQATFDLVNCMMLDPDDENENHPNMLFEDLANAAYNTVRFALKDLEFKNRENYIVLGLLGDIDYNRGEYFFSRDYFKKAVKYSCRSEYLTKLVDCYVKSDFANAGASAIDDIKDICPALYDDFFYGENLSIAKGWFYLCSR